MELQGVQTHHFNLPPQICSDKRLGNCLVQRSGLWTERRKEGEGSPGSGGRGVRGKREEGRSGDYRTCILVRRPAANLEGVKGAIADGEVPRET